MPGLEANPHLSCGCPLGPGDVIPARIRHTAGEVLHRHRHNAAFAALVLSGSYMEAGDTGLHRVEPGDVIFHHPYESHLDRFSNGGAEVLTLHLAGDLPDGALRRVADPDAIAQLAEKDRTGAARALIFESVPVAFAANDWPEVLAADLIADPGLSIAVWARQRRLHPGSVGRGFRQQFGITAAGFRSAARGLRALRDIRTTAGRLSDIAAAAGYADQAHMTRAASRMTGSPPARLRGIYASTEIVHSNVGPDAVTRILAATRLWRPDGAPRLN